MDFFTESRLPLFQTYLEKTAARYRDTSSTRLSLLIRSMDHSLGGTGKRLRPLLAFASGEFLGIDSKKLLPAACAIEFIHTYSLVHDDLPSMDDDDTRRGQPSSHVKFGEAVAILTGDALLTEAFGQMTLLKNEGFEPDHVLEAIETLVYYSGIHGMVGGQVLDVTTAPKSYTIPEIEFIHIHKTGALILASVLIPGFLVGLEKTKLDRLKRYGEAVGLAFQISDDLLDSDASNRYARKPRNKPKPSYTDVMTPTEMKEKLTLLVDTAIRSVDGGKEAKPLVTIAEFIRDRRA